MKKLNRYYLLNELKNLIGNWYIPFFGIVFPLLMTQIIIRAVLRDVPETAVQQVTTTIALSFLQLVPLAVVFLGHASLYSQEMEKRVPLRMQLFGYSQSTQMFSRMISLLLFFTFGLFLNLLVFYLSLNLLAPTLQGFLLTLLVYYILGIILFMLAHGIANFFRKFGPTYGLGMTLYFAFMILGGLMGITRDQLPSLLKPLSNLLPFGYIAEDIYRVWIGQSYNWMPLIQSLLFLGGVSAIVMLLSFRYRKNQAI